MKEGALVFGKGSDAEKHVTLPHWLVTVLRKTTWKGLLEWKIFIITLFENLCWWVVFPRKPLRLSAGTPGCKRLRSGGGIGRTAAKKKSK